MKFKHTVVWKDLWKDLCTYGTSWGRTMVSFTISLMVWVCNWSKKQLIKIFILFWSCWVYTNYWTLGLKPTKIVTRDNNKFIPQKLAVVATLCTSFGISSAPSPVLLTCREMHLPHYLPTKNMKPFLHKGRVF
jgi:hypothetical protein